MRKKLDMELLRQITEEELEKISENEIWLSELVEEVANRYAKEIFPNYPFYSLPRRKIKQSECVVRNIAQNFGWVAKRKNLQQDFFINGKFFSKQKYLCRLYRLQEEE
jgi:hypothetical protein|tara:strand:- start:646 stop:969 length:324 start_codon:yes stop_codon:yes gene_type:complete